MSLDRLDLIITADGSHTFHNTRLNETYHSRHGAIQESAHVFLQNGLQHRLLHEESRSLNILEIGFGTGLNILLTALWCRDNSGSQIRVTTLEPYPLTKFQLLQLNYPGILGGSAPEIFKAIHNAPWDQQAKLLPNLTLRKLQEPLERFRDDVLFDLCYYDAFAPSYQPEMWDLMALTKIKSLLKLEKGTLVTYCAQGQFQRDLKALGFRIELLSGPPGKAEMVRASLGAQENL